MTKYNISIEQPMLITFEVESETIEKALELAKVKFNTNTPEENLKDADFGTDAQIQAESEDGTEVTEWSDL